MVAAIDLNRASPDQRTDSRVVFAGTFAIVLTVAEMALDAATWVELDVATIYGIPLVLAAFARQRTLLWALTAALAVATFVIYAFQIPVGTFELHEALFVNRVLDAVALLLIAGLLHVWTASLEIREAQAELLQEQKRKLEAANALLVDHEAQIVRQNEELTRRRQEAEQASDRKTRILNAVSHDIRNPVNAIDLMAEVLRRTAEDPARAQQIPQIARRLQHNARSLVALVSEVLDIAQIDSGRLELRASTFSLNEFIDAKCRDLAPLAEAKSLRLDCKPWERTICVRTDRGKLDRVITNLVTNAIKFTAAGSVAISAAVATDGAAMICVRDTGVGIAEHELDRIFDEFTQVDPPLGNRNTGWGLGLAICRRLASFIGASIGVESKPGEGSVFTVRLPPGYVVDIAPVALLGFAASPG